MFLQGLRYASSCILAGLPAAITLCRGQDLGPTSSSSPSSFPSVSPASSSSSSPRSFPDSLETAREDDISFYRAPGGTYDTKTQKPYPIIRRAAVREHNSEESAWVIYKDGVYDITNFVSQHPGGNKMILQAAGKNLEPFWQRYRVHFNTKEALQILAENRIGTLYVEDLEEFPSFTPLGTPSASGMLPDAMDPEIKDKLYSLRVKIWLGGGKGLLIGMWTGYIIYAIVSKTSRLKHLKWGKNHRMCSLFIGGALGSFVGAVGTGRQSLQGEHRDLPMMMEKPASEYGKIMLENKRKDWERMNDSGAFARRAEALKSKRMLETVDETGNMKK